MTGFIPILFKEFRTYIRGYRTAVILTVYLALLLLGVWWLYDSITAQVRLGVPLLSPQIGQALYLGLAIALQTLTVFIAPALTLNAVSNEYEQGTIEVLLTTPLAAGQILLTKLLVALAFMLVLLVCTLPLFSVVVLFGGVNPLDAVPAVVTVLLTVLAGCVLGLFCSTVTRQTYVATILCYALLITLVGGTLFAANLWSLTNGQAPAPPAYVVSNPLSAMAAALASNLPPELAGQGQLRPITILGLLSQGTVVQTGTELAVVPIYRATWLLYWFVSLLLFWVSHRALQFVQRRRVLLLGGTDAILVVLLVLSLVVAFVTQDLWRVGL